MTKRTSSEKKTGVARKLFVFDTNVLMHDPTSLLRFEEHDIYIPQVVLEELDNHKKGTTDIARNSRETSRFIEGLIQEMEKRDLDWKIADGLPLQHAVGGKSSMGKIFVQVDEEADHARRAMVTYGTEDKPDNRILFTARMLKEVRRDEYSAVVIVSKDINVRIKARALGVRAEDYANDLISTDSDKNLYTGMTEIADADWEPVEEVRPPSSEGDTAIYRIAIPKGMALYPNQLLTGPRTPCAIVSHTSSGFADIRHCQNYAKRAISGIYARNIEQNFLANLLMSSEIDIITILGSAGTGKTLFTLAAGLELKSMGVISGITITRATVPVGEDIGFLPGTEEDKMGAWMGALEDNLEVIAEAMGQRKSDGSGVNRLKAKYNADRKDDAEIESKFTASVLKREFQIKSMSFMRGRTFLRKMVIVDEAQNLTPKQMRMLITRAGPETKIVCLGNLGQIDTPYLTETSSGLAYLVDRFKSWEHYGHVTLSRVERSRLAEHAVNVL